MGDAHDVTSLRGAKKFLKCKLVKGLKYKSDTSSVIIGTEIMKHNQICYSKSSRQELQISLLQSLMIFITSLYYYLQWFVV